MKNLIQLIIGKSKEECRQLATLILKTNRNVSEIMQAYKLGCIRIGFDLIESVAVGREENYILERDASLLVDAGFSLNAYTEFGLTADEGGGFSFHGTDVWADIFLFFVEIGDPEFEYEEPDIQSISIGGFGLYSESLSELWNTPV